MDDVIYLHDGSFEGLLTAVAVAIKSEGGVQGVYSIKQYRPLVYVSVREIETDVDQAERLLDYLRRISKSAVHLFVQAFLSEDKEAGNYLVTFIQLLLSKGAAAISLRTNEAVHALKALSKKVGVEAHRLNGMLRFRILEGDIQYAPFQSDHNVIGYCARHFQKRFTNRKWILHDTGRDFALYWDTKSLQPVEIDREMAEYTRRHGEIPEDQLTAEELEYQRLWRNFHHSISNEGRENKLLQRSFMPKRYWHYLVEKL